jgi:lipopolysaccharide export system permease protein
MNRLDRYVAAEFSRIFLLFTLAAPMLFVLGDWTDNLGTFADQGLTLRQVTLGYMYQFPLFVLWSLPIAALIGTVFTVSNMTRHSEMTAAKAGGVSFFRALRVLPVLGILLTFAGLGLGELVPITMGKRAAVLGESRGNDASRTDFVYRGETGHVYAIRQLDARSGRIYGLTIEGNGAAAAGEERVHIYSRDASWDAESRAWTLRDGFRRVYGVEGEEQTIPFRDLTTELIAESPEQLLATPREVEELTYAEIGRAIERLERSGGQSLELRVERAQKISIPVATLIIILFGAPLANTSARGGPAYGIGISLGITIAYMMLLRLATAAGATGQLSPMLAAWLPNALVAAGALVLLTRVRT